MDYAALADRFDFMRDSYRHKTPLERFLDLWQADAAWMRGNYEDAWCFRRTHRLSIDHVFNIRMRCEETSLTARDLQGLPLTTSAAKMHLHSSRNVMLARRSCVGRTVAHFSMSSRAT